MEDEQVRFWTIQPRQLWEQMERGESVRVDPDHPRYGGERPWQYDWLSAGLQRHHSGFDGGWPWWLSCIEPDLDQHRSVVLPGGRDQVSIQLELAETRYATFPLWMWETIHTGHYLAFTQEDLDEWHGALDSAGLGPDTAPLPEPWRGRLESSWERIFDRGPHPRFWYRDREVSEDDSGRNTLMREASEDPVGLTQELRASDVLKVVLFTAVE